MISVRSVSYNIGWTLLLLAILMIIPTIIDLSSADDNWICFLNSVIITTFIGGLLIAASFKKEQRKMQSREMILYFLSFWFIVPIFASLPIIYSSFSLNVYDCILESVSALSTTGTTVIYGFNSVSHGLLVWRSILQLFGAIVFISFSYDIVKLTVSNDVLYQSDACNVINLADNQSRIKYVIAIYSALIFISMSIFMVSGSINLTEAFSLASSALSSSGMFHENIMIYADSNVLIMCTITVLMLISGCPTHSLISFTKGYWGVVKDKQFKMYLYVILFAFLIVLSTDCISNGEFFSNVLNSLYASISSITTSGSQSFACDQPAKVVTFFCGFIGGCFGSATGGFKIFRMLLLFRLITSGILKFSQSNRYITTHDKAQKLSKDEIIQISSYFFLFFMLLIVLSYMVSLFNIDFFRAFCYISTSLSNNGVYTVEYVLTPSDITSLPNAVKMILSFAMICGRMEFIALFSVLTRRFWK